MGRPPHYGVSNPDTYLHMALESESKNPSSVVDRSVRLFQFLREFASTRVTVVRDLGDYDEVLWLSDLPREIGWTSACWNLSEEERASLDEEVWVRAVKPKIIPPPAMPATLTPWINQGEAEDFRRDSPPALAKEMFETIQEKNEAGEMVERTLVRRIEDYPDTASAYQAWIEQSWRPWAVEAKNIDPIQEIYGKLFSLYQRQKRLGDAYEVVLGLGLLTCKPDGQSLVRRHLVTAQTEITFEAGRGIITITAAADGAKLSLETDMLEVKHRPDNDEELSSELRRIGDRWWDQTEIEPILRSWTNLFSPDAQYHHLSDRPSPNNQGALVYFAPALILRKRTARSLVQICEKIANQIKTAPPEKVPLGVRSFVETIDGDKTISELTGGERTGGNYEDDEIYFPLPSNEQQRKIIERLNANHGVLVQGPPGTGKSQTIANLICHLLASGKRILVTSETARALQSLSEKIPEEVQALCVALLGNDRRAHELMEESVSGITYRYNSWDRATNKKNIDQLRQQLAKARGRLAQAMDKLRTLREAETLNHQAPAAHYSGKLSEIARQLAVEEDELSWAKPFIEATSEQVPTPGDLLKLREHLLALPVVGPRSCPNIHLRIDDIPTPERLEALVLLERQMKSKVADNRPSGQLAGFERLITLPIETLANLTRASKLIKSILTKAQSHFYSWSERVLREVLSEKDRAWRTLLRQTEETSSEIEAAIRQIGRMHVDVPDTMSVTTARSDCLALLRYLEDGGRLKGLFGRPKQIKRISYLLEDIRVNGRTVSTLEDVRSLLSWLSIHALLNSLKSAWAPIVELTTSSPDTLLAEFQDLCEPLREAVGLHEQMVAVREELLALGDVHVPRWHDLGEVESLCELLESAERHARYAKAEKDITDVLQVVEDASEGNIRPKPIVDLLSALRCRDEHLYRTSYYIIADALEANIQLAEFKTLSGHVQRNTPALYAALAGNPGDSSWNPRLAVFDRAYDWVTTDRWLAQLTAVGAQEKFSREVEQANLDISLALRDLSVALAWGYFFERLTESHRQHLIAWSKNMQAVGKGTGKYAAQKRAAARDNMEKCRSAIPAWIMPIYRVAETIEPQPKAFDVVIVDEASQSGPEALFLEYIAKKIIVVGDDKQIAPEFVGVDKEEINQLRRRYLFDLPHAENVGADDSFFDLARIRFPGFIRLREHFRCMPEIIQFSNNLSYADEPLQPLKQYSANRLSPLRVAYVAGAYTEGQRSICNPVEADRLVHQIKECCEDPRYNGKTFGVISLLASSGQAREVERKLINLIGADEMERRRLVCGSAYDFQGDERDVIFLSMVAAPSDTKAISALTHVRYQRAYNVAASRAKEQMWLFHSVQLKDLNPSCFRARLISYFLNPKVEQTGVGVGAVPYDVRVQPFESLFEQRVYRLIAAKGYRVIPQFPIAGYFIDLVVEGMQGRMAVECDGDHWHGPQEHDRDMARQRQLERCGWTFCRIRESVFYRDPDAAMESLWKTLNRLSIHPHGYVPTVEESISAPKINNADPSEALPGEVGTKTVMSAEQSASADQKHSLLYCEEYKEWNGMQLPDPRRASSQEVSDALRLIIDVEGPIHVGYLFRTYIRGAQIGKLGSQIEGELMKALERLIKRGDVSKEIQGKPSDKVNWIVRLSSKPSVRLRTSGQRTLPEIPVTELAALMATFAQGDTEEIYRLTLAALGFKRMTAGVKSILDAAYSRLPAATDSKNVVDKIPTPVYP